jgi:hypothetical protein
MRKREKKRAREKENSRYLGGRICFLSVMSTKFVEF